MSRGFLRSSRVLAVLASLPLGAATAGADEIPIDDFSGMVSYSVLDPNGLGQILLPSSTGELDYLGDLTGMTLAYDLGGISLTAGGNTALSLEILSLVPSTGPVHLAVTVNGGTPAYEVSIIATGPLFLPYENFSNPSAFSSVNELRFVFSADTSFAFAADDLMAVPEPGSAALLALGLLGLGLAGRVCSAR